MFVKSMVTMKYVCALPVSFNTLYYHYYGTICLIPYLYFFVAWNPSILLRISGRIIRGVGVGGGRVVQPPRMAEPKGRQNG